jgi:tRNA(Ile)-lysidine synthase
MSFSPEALAQRLRALPQAASYVVGFSGGLDSSVLLHAFAALREDLPKLRLAAWHIDHGLQPQSEAWGAHCAQVCAALELPLRRLPVQVEKTGQGPEADARAARLMAVAEALGPGEAWVTAQHADDQAETLLLQLLRGAGPAGLAGMPECATLGAGLQLRPLLGFERAALAAYAETQGLSWVEDPSNADPAFDRNYLRHEIVPRLRARWPALATVLGRAARHQAAAQGLLATFGSGDLAACAGQRPGTLSITALRALGRSRALNALRQAIAAAGLPAAPERALTRIWEDLMPARADARPRVGWGPAQARRYRDDLYLMTAPPPHDAARVWPWPAGQASMELPALGLRLDAATLKAGGLDLEAVAEPVSLRFRRGGERLRLRVGGSRALKTLLQEWGVPPWVRDRLPLVYVGEQLRAVLLPDGRGSVEVVAEPGDAQAPTPKPDVGVGCEGGEE